MSCELTVVTLLLDRPFRHKVFLENRQRLPGLRSHAVPDGQHPAEVVRRLRMSGLRYRALEDNHAAHGDDMRTYGTLAAFIGKFEGFAMQVRARWPMAVFLEDDVRVDERLPEHVCSEVAPRLREPPEEGFGRAQLGAWGEAYVMSLSGAHRTLRCLCQLGIHRNIDTQLARFCGPEWRVRAVRQLEGGPWIRRHRSHVTNACVVLQVPTPSGLLSALVAPNEGEAKRTGPVNETELRLAFHPQITSTCAQLMPQLSRRPPEGPIAADAAPPAGESSRLAGQRTAAQSELRAAQHSSQAAQHSSHGTQHLSHGTQHAAASGPSAQTNCSDGRVLSEWSGRCVLPPWARFSTCRAELDADWPRGVLCLQHGWMQEHCGERGTCRASNAFHRACATLIAAWRAAVGAPRRMPRRSHAGCTLGCTLTERAVWRLEISQLCQIAPAVRAR